MKAVNFTHYETTQALVARLTILLKETSVIALHDNTTVHGYFLAPTIDDEALRQTLIEINKETLL